MQRLTVFLFTFSFIHIWLAFVMSCHDVLELITIEFITNAWTVCIYKIIIYLNLSKYRIVVKIYDFGLFFVYSCTHASSVNRFVLFFLFVFCFLLFEAKKKKMKSFSYWEIGKLMCKCECSKCDFVCTKWI